VPDDPHSRRVAVLWFDELDLSHAVNKLVALSGMFVVAAYGVHDLDDHSSFSF
jgi:hypothetical protein